VDGGIDPTYIALSPQGFDPAPGTNQKLWIDGANNLVYNQSAGTNLIVVATATGSVNSSDIAGNSIDSSHIVDGSIGSADINWGTGAGQINASVIPYTPADFSDWPSNVDPGNTNDALDTLASMVHNIETGGLNDLVNGNGIATLVYNGGSQETVRVNLAASGGLEFTGIDSAIAVEVGDFTGNGLAGSDRNLYVDVNPSGALDNNFSGSGQLGVLVDGSTIGISGNRLYVLNAGITEVQLNSSVAGNGLAGGSGSALSVNVTNGLQIVSDSVQIDENNIPFAPATPSNWNGGVDPGNVDDALDSLASRVNGILTGTLQDLIAGNGLSGANYDGSASQTWSVDVNANGGLTNNFSGSGQLGINTDGFISINGSNQLQIDATSAGNGLTGGAGAALDVNPGAGITISSDAVAIDDSWFNGDATVNAAGVITLGNDVVDSTNISDGSVVTADIKDAAITTAKISDGSVSTAKISDQNVTSAKIDPTDDYTVNNITTKQRFIVDQANGYGLRLRIFSGPSATPSGLTWAADGDMIIWDDNSSGHDYKICVYVGESYGSGHWECTDVN